jgi:hypothetical protein
MKDETLEDAIESLKQRVARLEATVFSEPEPGPNPVPETEEIPPSDLVESPQEESG